MTTEVVVVSLAALGVTALSVPICVVGARRYGLMDRPGPLKTHDAAVPYLGGVAVFAGAAVGAGAGRPIVLIPMAGALAVGMVDDRFVVPPQFRLIAQLGVGAVIAAAQPVHLPGLLGVPLVMAATVVLINGFNLLDGLDMLAAGVGVAGAIAFAVITHGAGRLMAASLAGALVGFLVYNRPPARIYLGDGGSYLLGASMTLLLAQAWGVGIAGSTGVVALALLAVPVGEVAGAIVRRRRSGGSILSGDRGHAYDRLVAGGWSRTAASGVYIGIEVAVAAAVAAVAVRHASMAVALGIDVVMAVVVLGGAALVGGLTDATGNRP
jgi:UDP-GlcNAc:undecaprenyl-phosphate/decaprenyl-phosphate GlcNAc-1-phosphate transferase